MGGPRATLLAKQIRDALRARGYDGEPDRPLAATAAWLEGKSLDTRRRGMREIAAREGFPGMVTTGVTFQLDSDGDAWRRALAEIARNLPITRYGVYVSPAGLAAVVFGRMEVTLTPFPRRFQPGAVFHLHGEVAARHDHARVYLTRPDGKIDETPLSGRQVDVSLPLPRPGVYRVEVMSAGAGGPEVLANVPLYVGVDDPPWASPPPSDGVGPAVPAATEARMLELLNEARRAARLPTLAADPQLRAVAIMHTEEMIAGHFFGHVSPTSGRVDDRLKRAGVIVSVSGENVVQSNTAENAHRSLMDSPAHRANMLEAKFTHVGIGVAARRNESGELVATLVFVRRPQRPAVPVTPAVVATFISSQRRAKGADPIAVDPVLQRAAETGIALLTGAGTATPEQAISAAQNTLVSESRRLKINRGAVCVVLEQVLELDELEQDPLVFQPRPLKLGLATTTKTIGNGFKIFVLILAEGATCQ